MRTLLLLPCLALIGCSDPAPAPGASATPSSSASTTAKTTASAKPSAMTTPPPASAAPAPSASAAQLEPLDPDAKWNGKWPLPQMMSANTCKTASGEPGLTVNGKECHNPCQLGMAPESAMQCVSKCTADADCTYGGRRGTCNAGLCKRPKTQSCPDNKAPSSCKTSDGKDGERCDPADECISLEQLCPSGLTMYGGTHCTKACKQASDCPKGTCSEDICGPICPSEGCPYLWE